MIRILASVWMVALLSGFQAHAQAVQVLETCDLSGQLQLKGDTQIVCPGHLKVADGTQIITQGYNLLFEPGVLEVNGSLKIREYDEQNIDVARPDSGRITILARACIGKLAIDNRPAKADGLGGDVKVECLTTLDYDHEIEPGFAAAVTFIRNGDTQPLVGALYRPPL